MTGACLYVGRVAHSRLAPKRHSFGYRVFSLYADLDALPALGRRLRLFSHNRPNMVSFWDRDHGDGSGAPLCDWVAGRLADAGLAADGRVSLLCFPRLFGYAFNPLAVYYCRDRHDALAAVVYQVTNTFGERHSYVLPVDGEDGAIRQACDKAFYVSPFFEVAGGYAFRLNDPADRLSMVIRYGQDGRDLFVASHTGARVPVTDRRLAGLMVSHPLMTLKVIGGIHWQAFRLWRKGVPLVKKPPPVAPTAVSSKLMSQRPPRAAQFSLSPRGRGSG